MRFEPGLEGEEGRDFHRPSLPQGSAVAAAARKQWALAGQKKKKKRKKK